jgi:hypothetical protein
VGCFYLGIEDISKYTMDASSKFDDLLLNFGGYPPIWTYAFLGL